MKDPSVMAMANDRLEQAIEDLRVKYEKIRAEEAKEEAAKAKAEEAAKEAEEAKKEKDWELEDPDMERLRQQRMAQLRDAAVARKQNQERGNGELREIVEEDFLKEVTGAPNVIMHFFHPEFERCKVMDKYLRQIAFLPGCLPVRFLRLNATKAPFFSDKLRIKVLPTVVFFKEGVAIGRVTGFEGIAAGTKNDDINPTKLLQLIKLSGLLGDSQKKAAAEEAEGDDSEEENETTSRVRSAYGARLARTRDDY